MEPKQKHAANAQTQQTLRARTQVFPASTTAAQLLSSFNPEKKLPQARPVEVHEGRLGLIMGAFFKSLGSVTPHTPVKSGFFPICKKQVAGIHCTQEELTQFVEMLSKMQEHEHFHLSGLFISALLNSSKHDNFTIDLKHFESASDITCLCFRNEKTVTVNINGEAGWEFGDENSGSLTINGNTRFGICNKNFGTIAMNGNCGAGFGSSNSGTITITGKAGKKAASHNRGNFTINGSAGSNLGEGMESGTLTVNGAAGNKIGPIYGGKVFLNGKYGKLARRRKTRKYEKFQITPVGGTPFTPYTEPDTRPMRGKIYHNGMLIAEGELMGEALFKRHPRLAKAGKLEMVEQ